MAISSSSRDISVSVCRWLQSSSMLDLRLEAFTFGSVSIEQKKHVNLTLPCQYFLFFTDETLFLPQMQAILCPYSGVLVDAVPNAELAPSFANQFPTSLICPTGVKNPSDQVCNDLPHFRVIFKGSSETYFKPFLKSDWVTSPTYVYNCYCIVKDNQ